MKILATAFMLAFLLLLTGCNTLQSGTQIAEVPIVTRCSPETKVTEISTHPINQITKEMTMFDKVKFILAELELVTGQNTELKAALSECTK